MRFHSRDFSGIITKTNPSASALKWIRKLVALLALFSIDGNKGRSLNDRQTSTFQKRLLTSRSVFNLSPDLKEKADERQLSSAATWTVRASSRRRTRSVASLWKSSVPNRRGGRNVARRKSAASASISKRWRYRSSGRGTYSRGTCRWKSDASRPAVAQTGRCGTRGRSGRKSP